MDDDALLLSAFRKLVDGDEVYISLGARDRTPPGSFPFCVDGTTWSLTIEERDAVERLLLASGRDRYGSLV